MKKSGFTLVELMIALGIIATVAAITIPSLLRARLVANQTAAVAACRVYAESQEIYRRSDYDRDGVLEYAAALRGDNSLLETQAGLCDLALIDRCFAEAEGDPDVGAVPRSGYVFRVLTIQGPAANGGALAYVVGGNMVLGYGLSGVPAAYDLSGHDSFIINNTATTYQKDTGGSTHQTVFDPDGTWAQAN